MPPATKQKTSDAAPENGASNEKEKGKQKEKSKSKSKSENAFQEAADQVSKALAEGARKDSYRIKLSDAALKNLHVEITKVDSSNADAKYSIYDTIARQKNPKAFWKACACLFAAGFSSLHGIGKKSDKYTESDMAARRRVLQCRTYIKEKILNELIRDEKADIKAQQMYCIQQLLKSLQIIHKSQWNCPHVKEKLKTTLRTAAMKKINKDKKRLKKLGVSQVGLDHPAVDKDAFEEFLEGENFVTSIKEDEDHPGEYIVTFKTKVFQWKNKETQPGPDDKYSVAAVEAAYAVEPGVDVAHMSPEEWEEGFAIFAKKFMEARGYKYKPIQYFTKGDKEIKGIPFTKRAIYSTLIVRPWFTFGAFSLTSGKYGDRLTLTDRVDIIKKVKAPKFEEKGDHLTCGDEEVTWAQLEALQTKREDGSDSESDVENVTNGTLGMDENMPPEGDVEHAPLNEAEEMGDADSDAESESDVASASAPGSDMDVNEEGEEDDAGEGDKVSEAENEEEEGQEQEGEGEMAEGDGEGNGDGEEEAGPDGDPAESENEEQGEVESEEVPINGNKRSRGEEEKVNRKRRRN